MVAVVEVEIQSDKTEVSKNLLWCYQIVLFCWYWKITGLVDNWFVGIGSVQVFFAAAMDCCY